MRAAPVRVWIVFFTYGLAAVAILLMSVVAGMVLHALEPDIPPAEVFQGLRGLIAGGIASSGALLCTVFVATRGIPPSRIRLAPGHETGRHLLVMVVGVLSLGQALDSITVVTGSSERGAMAVIRQALAGASGFDLFAAVVVIGVLAGAAEEIFFRGYMQSLLRERWRPGTAVVVTGVCFSALHLDLVHAAVALALGLALGFITELSGSALPAAACHVVNNSAFTLLTAALGQLPGGTLNLTLLAVTAVVFLACVVWLHRSMR
jgi:membrane protease YdiL (CAAX protease family)